MTIYEELIEAQKQSRPYALATIVKTIGCSPRSAGTKMLVFQDGSIKGTVGGGMAERLVIKDALSCMRSGKPLLKTYSPDVVFGQDQEADCEKVIEVFIEPGIVVPHLYLLGAGHVAQAIIPYAKQIGFYVTILDTKDTTGFAEALSGADEVIQIEQYDRIDPALAVPKGYYVICTSSHATDGDALAGVLPLDTAYIGMLGAKHKFMPIFEKMRSLGYTDEQLMEIHAPVGLDIGGESLQEIGLGIVAELMAVRYGKTAGFLRDKKRGDMFPGK